ncbi:MAG: hypothetical protein ACFB0G_08540 [Leptolyngbyaceae cyanobacterium]
MALQKFSIVLLQKVRQHVQSQLVLPVSEQNPVADSSEREQAIAEFEPTSLDALGDLFRVGGFDDEDETAPNTEGRWFISTANPAAAIYKLPGLSLKPKVRLVTYLQRQPKGGMGVTWALPELMSTTAILEDALTSSSSGTIPPHPNGALGNVMDGMAGDRTAGSYLAASILLRELKEFGRSGLNRRWFYHQLIATPPPDKTWQWRTKQPLVDMSPKVQIQDNNTVLVEFFSYRMAPPIAIFRHVDHYVAKSYRPKTHDQVVALP